MEHLVETMKQLNNTGVTFELKKSFFFQQSIDFLGQMTARDKLQGVQKTKKAVETLQYAKKVSKFSLFLRLSNVSRRFSSGFVCLSTPSHSRLKKDELLQLKLNKGRRQILNTLKMKLASLLVLTLSHAEGQFTTDTDICETWLGWVFSTRTEEQSI